MAYWRLGGFGDTMHGYASRKLELGDEGKIIIYKREKNVRQTIYFNISIV